MTACVWSGVLTTTASMSCRSSRWRKLPNVRAPGNWAEAAASRFESMSQSATMFSPFTPARFSPPRPATPMMPRFNFELGEIRRTPGPEQATNEDPAKMAKAEPWRNWRRLRGMGVFCHGPTADAKSQVCLGPKVEHPRPLHLQQKARSILQIHRVFAPFHRKDPISSLRPSCKLE